jgi:ribonuclease Z
MSSVCFLGTSNAVPYKNHENTCLAIQHAAETILIDCPASPSPQLARAGIDPLAVNYLVLTHFHPDHVGGVPLFLMNVWLMGRKEPLYIYGNSDCIGRLKELMNLYRWETWPNLFSIEYVEIPPENKAHVLNISDLDILAAPVKHIIPTIALSFSDRKTGGKLTYSSDTEPCDAVVSLAQNATVLIHEANGDMAGHSSAAQAGEIAEKAGVEKLVLVHYPETIKGEELQAQAGHTFSGAVFIAQDMDTIQF